jgi:hypothetical protein
MSATNSTECDCLKLAAANIVAHPTLSVKDALKLTDFTINEIEDKNLWQKVLWRLPGKGKHRMKESMSKGGEVGSVVAFVDIEKEQNSDVSPLTSDSMTSLLGSNGSRKPKSWQMTVAQKQE